MPPLRFDRDQRFSCRHCGRCCRGGEIAVTEAEVASYRRAEAGRWFREGTDAGEGAEVDPFLPVRGQPGLYRIRKRPDGACGFLSKQDRCRIHEELGPSRKPLTCRVFPFSFHPAQGPTLVRASFACPTVVANEGTPLTAQNRELMSLGKAWLRSHPEPPPELRLVKERPLGSVPLDILRQTLHRTLERTAAGEPYDLRANLRRMAAYLEDITRWRVLRLEDDDLTEYVKVMGRHAAEVGKPVVARRPTRQGKRLGRGLLFAVLASRLQRDDGRESGLRLGLRLRLFALLAHLHGLGPPVAGFDVRLVRRGAIDLDHTDVADVVRRYLRATIETLGTGRRQVVEELAFAVAILNAAAALAALRATRAGRATAGAEDLREGLVVAAELSHARPGGLVGALSGGVEALHVLASGGLWPRDARRGVISEQ
jgi:Fe-S-cluster containining protein